MVNNPYLVAHRDIQARREERMRAINNTDGYRNGNRIHQLRTIQIIDAAHWNQLFGRESLNPTLREYTQALFHPYQREEQITPRMEVSLLMMENYRPRVHVAVFIVYLVPHHPFYDGHIIQMEFSNDSYIHQTINRMFDVNEHAVVSQATEYEILNFAADPDEMLDLIHLCFIDRDFETMRFRRQEQVQDRRDRGGDEQPQRHIHMMEHEEVDGEYMMPALPPLIDDVDEPEVRIPPPPPPPHHNNFETIYREYYNMAYGQHGEHGDYYDDDDDDDNDDDEYEYDNEHEISEAQG
jgi:hypothetical protein